MSRGLGRGLDALIGGSEFSSLFQAASSSSLPEGIAADDNGTLWADVDLLSPNPHQMRTDFDEELLGELASSVKRHGVLEPVVVEQKEDKSGFFIIMGERRCRAAKMAGLKKVPVRLGKYDEEKRLEMALVENIQRADLNPMEEAKAYFNLMKMGDLSQEEVAYRVGKKRSTVTNALRLLKLPDEVKEALVSRSISAGHARAILAAGNEKESLSLFRRIVKENLSVREAEKLSKKNSSLKGDKTRHSEGVKLDSEIKRVEESLIKALGTKVTLKGSLKRGVIKIEYFSAADLSRVFALIAGEEE